MAHLGSERLICDHCNQVVKRKVDLIIHIKNIHKEGHKFGCDECYKVLSAKTDLSKHIQTQHQRRIRTYECQLCGRNFQCRSGLKFHHAVIHEGTKFECDKCGKVYGVKSLLVAHMAWVHELYRPWQCLVCGEKFMRHYSLQTHIAAKHEGKRLECDDCGAEFCRKTGLTMHVYSVHLQLGGLFSCVECEAEFTLNSSLNQHMKSVHEKQAFVCDVCGKSFGQKGHLAGHCFAVHMQLRTFKCPVCDRMFIAHCSLANHRRKIHT